MFRIIKLTDEERAALESGYEMGKKPVFRKRCHLVLLKSQGYSASEISAIIGLGILSVYHWLDRYEAEGIQGLNTKPGQGRKPILTKTDLPVVTKHIQNDCQRLSVAKAHLETELGRQVSASTLKRFLKVITADTSAFANARNRRRTKRSMSIRLNASPRLKGSLKKGI